MQFPPDLLAILPAGTGVVVEQWWVTLSDSERQRVAGLWDERLEVSFFSPQSDSDGQLDAWEQVPTTRGGCFAPKGDDGRAEWLLDYFEHLIEHPELVIGYEAPRRTFHICTRHSAARACIAAGGVSIVFACPVSAESCPMLPLRGARFIKLAN